jgi:hypothetical protein
MAPYSQFIAKQHVMSMNRIVPSDHPANFAANCHYDMISEEKKDPLTKERGSL